MVWFELMLPRHLELIYEINRRLLDEVRARFPGDEGRIERVSLIDEPGERTVRMAHLAMVAFHSTNGVAAIHSGLLRTMTVRDLAEVFPKRFSNKTNRVTPRRWLRLCNPPLSGIISEAIGDGWITDLAKLAKLIPRADDPVFRPAFRQTKVEIAPWLKATSGQTIDPESRAALDLIFSDHFSRHEPGVFNPLRDVLLTKGDHYFHLADLVSYLEADRKLVERYADPEAWTRQAILNVAASGKFSNDRTIAEYASGIWGAKACPIS